ncbi:MAG: bacteriocin family protein [Actinomycetota bacterium]|nr:bacteriocin family protein [Actinomycetota bacterium]
MSHLLRSLAPITQAGWDLLDEEARQRLTAALAARKLVDFSGPHGWEHSATNLGRTEAINETPVQALDARRRRVLPLVELRALFSVSRDELRDGDRGAPDVDLTNLDEAAKRIALGENIAVFHGWKQAVIAGITDASPHPAIPRSKSFDRYPRHVAKAVELLLQSGIAGPYGLALGPDDYTAVIETSEHGGYPLFDHLRKILGGPIVWAPGVRGAVVLSLRGGDFLLESGQDLAIGYESHDPEAVHLYLEESFSFRVATPEAAVALNA